MRRRHQKRCRKPHETLIGNVKWVMRMTGISCNSLSFNLRKQNKCNLRWGSFSLRLVKANNRVIKYWNQLPLRVRNSTSINAVKAGLDLFKLSKPDSPDAFWKLSEEIFNRISDKSEHVNYLLANRDFFLWMVLIFIFYREKVKYGRAPLAGGNKTTSTFAPCGFPRMKELHVKNWALESRDRVPHS